MIYINSSTIYAYFPKTSDSSVNKLKITNQTTHSSTSLTVQDLSNSLSFYKFDVSTLASESEGTYDYSISLNNNEIESGILQIGEFSSTNTEYNYVENLKTYEYNG